MLRGGTSPDVFLLLFAGDNFRGAISLPEAHYLERSALSSSLSFPLHSPIPNQSRAAITLTALCAFIVTNVTTATINYYYILLSTSLYVSLPVQACPLEVLCTH